MNEDQEQIERLTGIIYSYLNGNANGFGDKSMSPKLYNTREDASKFKPFSENSDKKENAKKFINNEEETINYLESRIIEKVINQIESKISGLVDGRDT